MNSSPLNHIKIASPCPADWDEMRGNQQKRFCTHCQLNVYNLSEMTEREAENFLFESEGRICVRLYRRKDGTVITQDCPVGWQAIKQKISRVTSAVFGLIIGFFGGIYGYSQLSFDNSKLLEDVSVESQSLVKAINGVPVNNEKQILVEEGQLTYEEPIISMGLTGKSDLESIQREFKKKPQYKEAVVGRIVNIRDLQDEPVELWVK